MAWQTGIIGLRGTIGDYTFCRNGVVRRRRRSNLAIFHTAPSLAPTRQNASEFGHASASARLLRQALTAPLQGLVSRSLCSRLTSRFRAIVSLDSAHPRGERRVLPPHVSALVGFQFTPGASLPSFLTSPASVQATPTGSFLIALPAFDPAYLGAWPRSATHCQRTVDVVLLDFAAGTARPVALTDPAPVLALDSASLSATALTATPASPATPTEVLVLVLGVRFFQQAGHQLLPSFGGQLASLAVGWVQPVAQLIATPAYPGATTPQVAPAPATTCYPGASAPASRQPTAPPRKRLVFLRKQLPPRVAVSLRRVPPAKSVAGRSPAPRRPGPAPPA